MSGLGDGRATAIVDFHNHIIPGVDDGAQTPEDSVSALRAMAQHGVTHIITTPHFDGSLTQRPAAAAERLAELDAGWARLQEIAKSVAGITVSRGAEVMLDTPTPDLSDPRLHLAGGTFVLVEFPFMTIPPESPRVLAYLRESGVIPVVAHPERYHGVVPDSNLPLEWKAAGAYLQVNGASLLGRYGKGPKANAKDLLARGLVDYLGSDYHTRGSPMVRQYCTWMREHGADEQVHLLTEVNPARLLRDERPLPVLALREQPKGWGRLLPWKK
jgi:protein-tyrosine phosphatase